MNLKQRLYSVLLGILILALIIGMVLLTGLTRQQMTQESKQRLQEVAELISQDVIFAMITDDLARLDQRLQIYVQQVVLREVRWNSAQGNGLMAQAQTVISAPSWFVSMIDLQPQVLRQQVVWFGKDYGEIVLTSDVAASLNQLWSLIQYWLWIMLGLLSTVILAIEALVQPSIKQVRRLADEAVRLGQGKLDEPIAIAGQAEFLVLSRAMEVMRRSFLQSTMRRQEQQRELLLVNSENEQRHQWLQSLLNNMRVAVLLEGSDHRVVFANQRYCDLFRIAVSPVTLKGYEGDRLAKEIMLLFAEPQAFVTSSQALITQGKPVSQQLFNMQDGRWLMRDFIPLVDKKEQKMGHFWMYQDVTDTYRLRQALADERDLAQVTLSSIGDGVITTNMLGLVTFINDEATRMTGWTQAQAAGRSILEVFKAVREGADDTWLNPVADVLASGRKVELSNHTLVLNKLTNCRVPIEDSVAPILDRLGKIIGAVLVFHDVSDKYALEQALRWQATHDALTQLISRQEFERLLHEAQSDPAEHALVYLDLDQFKLVNDTAGHLAGDELLRQVTSLFRQTVDDKHKLARMGGDEFAVLVSGDVSVAMSVAESLRAILVPHRYQHQGRTYQVTVSIGVVPNINSQSDTLMLMAMADAACYAAKYAGRNQVWLYKDGDAYLLSQQEEMSVVSDIHEALEHNRFELHAQQLIPLQPHDEHVGLHLEILLRLRDGDGNLVSPATFIPAAENYGLMHRVDRWVIANTLALLGANPSFLAAIDVCAINLSGQSFAQADLVSFIHDCMIKNDVPGHKICFEITETAAVSQLSHAADFIVAMRELGCQFALDDFGSGQSSFRYLKYLPVNYLKIDGSFVQDMLKDKMNEALVRGMHEVAQSLEIRTVAEFVETEDVANVLRDIGVDYAQGWHFHRAQQLQDLVEQHSKMSKLGVFHATQ